VALYAARLRHGVVSAGQSQLTRPWVGITLATRPTRHIAPRLFGNFGLIIYDVWPVRNN